MTNTTVHADTDGDMLDYVAMGILMLAGALVIAFFGIDAAQNGVVIMWNTIVQLSDSLFLGDFRGIGIFEEDSAVIDFVFDIRETVIGIYEYIYGQYLFHFVIQD